MKKIFVLVVSVVFMLCCCGCSNIVNDRNIQSDTMLESPLETMPDGIVYEKPQEVPAHTEYSDVIELPPETENKQDVAPDRKSIFSFNNSTEPIVTESVEPNDADFVRIIDYIPTATIELRYATQNNFTREVIYEFKDAWLRYGTVKKLMAVASELEKQGLYLKIWDGFRPVEAQFTLWDVCPNSKYVANPHEGFSSHSRGNTVDLTLIDKNGYELWMPTEFDDFSEKANRNYSDCSADITSNVLILENIMKEYGFEPYYNEWWHFSDTVSYDVEKTFNPAELG